MPCVEGGGSDDEESQEWLGQGVTSKDNEGRELMVDSETYVFFYAE